MFIRNSSSRLPESSIKIQIQMVISSMCKFGCSTHFFSSDSAITEQNAVAAFSLLPIPLVCCIMQQREASAADPLSCGGVEIVGGGGAGKKVDRAAAAAVLAASFSHLHFSTHANTATTSSTCTYELKTKISPDDAAAAAAALNALTTITHAQHMRGCQSRSILLHINDFCKCLLFQL